MAKGKFITELEREYIRIGYSIDLNAPAIAHYLGRDRVTVHNEINKMKKNETIGMIPFEFVVENIAKDMMRTEKARQAEMRG